MDYRGTDTPLDLSIKEKNANSSNRRYLTSIRLLKGIRDDLARRIPLYVSDWRDGIHSKVLSASVYMYFCSILPAITFAADLSDHTNNEYGVIEVLSSTALGGVFFSVFAGQPLVIMGVTGPVAIFSATIFNLCERLNIPFLPFMAWSSIWAALFHIVLAALNACRFLQYVTQFSCEIFGALIAAIYVSRAVQEVVKYFEAGTMEGALLGLMLCVGTFLVSIWLAGGRSWTLFRKNIRGTIADYGAAAAIIVFTAVPYLPRLSGVQISRLETPSSFNTTTGRPWLVPFWELETWAVFASMLPALVITVLFFFDHNVSSLLSQRPEFKLKKGPAFHYDFLILGICTLIAGLIGLPAPNGLIPQAPLHVQALSRMERDPLTGEERVESVVENRISPLLQSVLIGLTLSPPLLFVLRLIPRAILAGLFLVYAFQSLEENTIALRVQWIFTDRECKRPTSYLARVSARVILLFTTLQIALIALIFYVTVSPAAISFPVFILLLVPARRWMLPHLFTRKDLEVLDRDMMEWDSEIKESAEGKATLGEHKGEDA
ncbi:uncharacterized protein VTP21DRAFT_5401 [Calcarisporiella thermophila]|uniref:uncharacterized protein n=1 Tax=Calcarisporiella thermophila TaxID=911321 RepID=UPI003743D10D